MTDLLPTAPSPALLPPLPARGVGAPLPTGEEFKALLASQGLKSAGGVPSEQEARIAAAQIAAKAEVNARAKREPVIAGMAGPVTPQPAPVAGRFMPLRTGPAAARAFTAQVEQTPSNSLAGLRATRKFAPGPLRTTTASVPAVGLTLHRPGNPQAEIAAPAVPAAQAADAYAFGLRNAGPARPNVQQEVPAWFGDAMETGLEKYQAMKAAPR